MKKKAKKLTLAKSTLQELGRSTGGYYFDQYSDTAGFDHCICPRMIKPGQ